MGIKTFLASLPAFIEKENIKTVKDLKDYLEKTGNKIFLEG